MNSRVVLLSIAVVVVGLFAMPTTVSLYAGQHTFENASKVVSDNGCRKCHGDVYDEMHSALNGVHWKRTSLTPDTQFQCRECHNVTNVSVNYITGTKVNDSAHAATTVSCLACHSDAKGGGGNTNPMHQLAVKYGIWGSFDCGQCHRDTGNPGKYPDAYIIKVNSTITGSDEAHSIYYYKSKYPDNQTEIRLKDANAACIGCHTYTIMDITWKRPGGYNISYNWSNKAFDVWQLNSTTATNTTKKT